MSKSRINNYRDLLKKMLKRYFRFAVPLFIICLIVFLISKTIGFHVQEVAALQSNDWLATFYKRDLSLKRVFIDSFIRILFFKSVLFAGPFWMLSELFIASLFLLVCNYIRTKSNLLVALVFFLMAIAMMIRGSYVIVSCLLGYCISFYHSKLLKISSKTGERSLVGLLLVVILLSCTHSLICNYFGKFISVPRIFSINGWWNTVYAAIFFVLVSSIHSLQNILSSAVIKYSGEISFEIYCLHWPVLCSLGALLFLEVYPASYNAAFIITLICVLCATLGASILYNKTLGKVSTFIINRI